MTKSVSTHPARCHIPATLPCLTGCGLIGAFALTALIVAYPMGATAEQTSKPSAAPADKPVIKSPQSAEKKKPGDNASGGKKREAAPYEGTMTTARMEEIIRRLDKDVKVPRPGMWQFTISERPVIIVTDVLNNRMRILSPVSQTEGIPEGLLKRLMQANFDTALDARYAIARGVIWATFIHPLKALHDRQFISAIGQTVNLVLTFGTTFSSGAMSFGGGDSRDIIRKKLIEQLMKKGLPI